MTNEEIIQAAQRHRGNALLQAIRNYYHRHHDLTDLQRKRAISTLQTLGGGVK